MRQLEGIFPAAATPINQDGSPDSPTLVSHCKALLKDGCDGIALLGSTGEANSFGISERQNILEQVVAGGIDPNQLIPGTAQSNVTDTVTLTRLAVDMGVRAVVLLPPFYYKGVTDEGLYRAFSEVIDKVANSQLKIILYHIPHLSGIGISQALINRLKSAYPNTIVGVKDSSGDLENMRQTLNQCPDISVLAGADPLMLPLLKMGGSGCITATSNLLPGDLRFVFDNWNNSDMEREVEASQRRICSWRELTNSYTQLPTVKAMLAKKRNKESWMLVRPPFVELTEVERSALWLKMDQLAQQ
ncbi:MAG: dihydrodipicolinate synthase family protein [Balneolales bacterium]